MIFFFDCIRFCLTMQCFFFNNSFIIGYLYAVLSKEDLL